MLAQIDEPEEKKERKPREGENPENMKLEGMDLGEARITKAQLRK